MLYLMAVDGEPCLHELVDRTLVMVDPMRWREILSEGDLPEDAAVPVRAVTLREVLGRSEGRTDGRD